MDEMDLTDAEFEFLRGLPDSSNSVRWFVERYESAAEVNAATRAYVALSRAMRAQVEFLQQRLPNAQN